MLLQGCQEKLFTGRCPAEGILLQKCQSLPGVPADCSALQESAAREVACVPEDRCLRSHPHCRVWLLEKLCILEELPTGEATLLWEPEAREITLRAELGSEEATAVH